MQRLKRRLETIAGTSESCNGQSENKGSKVRFEVWKSCNLFVGLRRSLRKPVSPSQISQRAAGECRINCAMFGASNNTFGGGFGQQPPQQPAGGLFGGGGGFGAQQRELFARLNKLIEIDGVAMVL